MNVKEIINHAVRMYRFHDASIPTLLKRGEDLGRGRPACDTCTTPYCCNQLVTSWVEEVLLIAAVVKDTEYIEKLEEWYDWFKTLPFEDQVQDHKYFQHSRACPFLTDEKKCAIYDARPTACRGHYAYDDPKKCGSKDVSPVVLDTTAIGIALPPASLQFYVMPLAVYANATNNTEAGELAEKIQEEVKRLVKNGGYSKGVKRIR